MISKRKEIANTLWYLICAMHVLCYACFVLCMFCAMHVLCYACFVLCMFCAMHVHEYNVVDIWAWDALQLKLWVTYGNITWA